MFKKIRAYFERKFADIVFWEIDFWTTFMEDNALRDEDDDKRRSDEYRKGWIDALKQLEKILKIRCDELN